MRILAIDPGSEQSAWVQLDSSGVIRGHRKECNDIVVGYVQEEALVYPGEILAVEFPFARGMPASNQLFRTAMWAGRFIQVWKDRLSRATVLLINRHEVKLHHCGQARAKDSNIRASIIDRYGGKDEAIGLKKKPGPLYGVKADVWQALAIGLMVYDNMGSEGWLSEREVK